jgi:NTE family protein
MGTVGLVLGAGGIVGQAYHAGVLAALERETGWDPRSATEIVGSSAGSVTGALLRLGASAADMAAYACDQDLSEEGMSLFEVLGRRELDLPAPALRDLLRGRWRPPTPQLLARVARRPWALRPTVAAVTMMPPGSVDLCEYTAVLDGVPDRGPDDWPDGLLVCAARRNDGARTIFGRPGSPEAPLSRAVGASCAIPGYFAPVEIDGVEYVDGAVHSPTNADVLLRSGLDLVVVVSPMSAAHGRSRTADSAMRFAAHRRLCREADRLRAAGTAVLAFEPTATSLSHMGLNAMAEDRSAQVVEAAAEETTARLADPKLAARLDLLTGSEAAAAA